MQSDNLIEIPTHTFISGFKAIKGAFSVTECIALYNICLQAPVGHWMELGTHRGKSTSAIALAADGKKTSLYLLEPEFKDEQWKDEVAKEILAVNKWIKLFMLPVYSTDYITHHIGDFSFVFVDSGIHDDTVMEEVKMLEDRMIKDGIIAFHDYKNQFTAVERAYNYLVSTGKYEPIQINWDAIIYYVKEHNLEQGDNSWHIYEENPFPNFVGALKRK